MAVDATKPTESGELAPRKAGSNTTRVSAPIEAVLTPQQAHALLRELIEARILSCVHLAAAFELAESLTISLRDVAEMTEGRAVTMANGNRCTQHVLARQRS